MNLLEFILMFLLLDMVLLNINLAMNFFRNRKLYNFILCILLNLLCMPQLVAGSLICEGKKNFSFAVKICEAPFLAQIIIPASIFIYVVAGIFNEVRLHYTSITKSSIQTALNELDCGLLYMRVDGSIVLKNRKMEELSYCLTGEYLYSGFRLWNRIISFDESKGGRRIDFTQWPAILFSDGTVYSFERNLLKDADREYIEILARDVTKTYKKRSALSEENKKLIKLNYKLSRMLRSISESKNDEELLNYKIRIHDQLGNAILRTRKALRDKEFSDKNIEEILYVWKNTINAFEQNVSESNVFKEELKEVLNQAETLGVSLKIEGEFPGENRLAVRALREAMYNSIRHAYANEIKVVSRSLPDGYHIYISDDGVCPDITIHEGGGLSSLKREIEEAGGSMTVSVWNGVELSLFIKKEETDEEGTDS